MSDSSAPATDLSKRELVLTRILNVPRAKVFAAWTTPEILKQWFVPKPWTTSHAELDVRAGGSNYIVFRDPEGKEYPNRGVYLEVVKNERIVVTDAFVKAWEPSTKPFMTAILTFEDAGPGKTKYTARVRHWTEEDCATHVKMGFHEGWGQCATQLEELLGGGT